MGDSQKEIISFYKRRIEPFIAIFILTLLIVGGILLYQDNQLKKEISQNCGWGEEKYQCYCQKSDIDLVYEFKERGEEPILNHNFGGLDAPVVG